MRAGSWGESSRGNRRRRGEIGNPPSRRRWSTRASVWSPSSPPSRRLSSNSALAGSVAIRESFLPLAVSDEPSDREKLSISNNNNKKDTRKRWTEISGFCETKYKPRDSYRTIRIDQNIQGVRWLSCEKANRIVVNFIFWPLHLVLYFWTKAYALFYKLYYMPLLVLSPPRKVKKRAYILFYKW